MSYEAWGEPPDPEPDPCEWCEAEFIGSSADCRLCKEFARAEENSLELVKLRGIVRHRLRILRTRSVYEGGKLENGVSVELLMAMTLLQGVPGLDLEDVNPVALAEAEKALLTIANGQYIYGPSRTEREASLPSDQDAKAKP